MSPLIEQLECRALLSASPLAAVTVEQAVTALGTEANQARIDVAASAKTEAADLKVVKADLQRLKSVPANAALIKKFTKQEQAAYSQFKKDAASLASSVSKETRKSIAEAIQFLLHPGNAKATAALAGELTALQKLTTSGPAQRLVTDLDNDDALVTGDLNAIAATNAGDTRIVADATQAKKDLAAASSKLHADDTALEGDLTTLIDAVEAVEST